MAKNLYLFIFLSPLSEGGGIPKVQTDSDLEEK